MFISIFKYLPESIKLRFRLNHDKTIFDSKIINIFWSSSFDKLCWSPCSRFPLCFVSEQPSTTARAQLPDCDKAALSPTVSAKTKAVSIKYSLSASVKHNVEDDLFSFSPMTLDENMCDVMFSLSLVRSVRLSFIFNICLRSVLMSMRTRSPHTTSQHACIDSPSVDLTRSVRAKYPHAAPFHSFHSSHRFVFDALDSTCQPTSSLTTCTAQSSPKSVQLSCATSLTRR